MDGWIEWSNGRIDSRKAPRFALNRRLGVLQSRSERILGKTTWPCRDWHPGPSNPQLVTTPIIQHKPKKCTVSKLTFQFLILMSSICFEPEVSSSGRRLYMQLRYGMFYMHQYKQSYRYKSVFDTHFSTYKTA